MKHLIWLGLLVLALAGPAHAQTWRKLDAVASGIAAGGACSPNGATGADGAGLPYACKQGTWQAIVTGVAPGDGKCTWEGSFIFSGGNQVNPAVGSTCGANLLLSCTGGNFTATFIYDGSTCGGGG